MEILKQLRKKSGLTLRQIELDCKISNAYLSQLESGKIKNPSAIVLYKLAKLYSVSIEDLLLESGMLEGISIKSAIMKITDEERLANIEKRLAELEFYHTTFK